MALVFVTGATGQIGLPLVQALVAAGHQVRGLTRTEAGADRIRQAGGTPILGGLSDTAALNQGIEGAAWIFHLAGGVRGKGQDTAEVLNHQGTRAIVEVTQKYQKDIQAFVLASSCAVYGDRNGLWVTEAYPPSPQTLYGQSKMAAEQVALAAAQQGLGVRIARISAVYGPGFRMMLQDEMKKGRAWLPGEGLNLLPLVHVADCVAALILIAEKGQSGEIYHVVGRSTPQLKAFYKAVHQKAGGNPVRFWSTWIPSAFQTRAASLNERLQAKIGQKPRFTNDNLKLWTAGVRLKADRLEKELGFNWQYPEHEAGIAASIGA